MSHENQIVPSPARASSELVVPVPRVAIEIRVATLADVPFMDGLQKKYGKALGYFPTKQFEGYVGSGGVLIAEEKRTADDADSADKNLNSSVPSVQSVVKSLGY